MTTLTFETTSNSNLSFVEPIRKASGFGLRMRRIKHALTELRYCGGTSDYMIAMRFAGSNGITRYDGNRVEGRTTNIGGVCISGVEHEHGWHFPDPIEVFHFYLNRSDLESIVETDMGLDGTHLQITPAWNEGDPFLYQMAVAADQALRTSTPTDRLFLDQLDATVKSYFLKRYSNFGHKPQHMQDCCDAGDLRISRVMDYVEEHLGSVIKIADLAAVAGMSASNLMRAFKASVGQPIAGYVRERRLQRACDMITNSPKGLSQIAYELGFSDHSHFTRSFKQRFGVTPRAWRQ